MDQTSIIPLKGSNTKLLIASHLEASTRILVSFWFQKLDTLAWKFPVHFCHSSFKQAHANQLTHHFDRCIIIVHGDCFIGSLIRLCKIKNQRNNLDWTSESSWSSKFSINASPLDNEGNVVVGRWVFVRDTKDCRVASKALPFPSTSGSFVVDSLLPFFL